MDNETPAPTDTPAPVEPTQIPVTEEPVTEPAPEVAPVSEPVVDQQPAVEGSPEAPVPSGEQVGEPQPEAPLPSPATASPDTDQVTVNTHLRGISSNLESVKSYVENFLSSHPAKGSINDALDNVINIVNENVK